MRLIVLLCVVLSGCAQQMQLQGPVGHDFALAAFGGFVMDRTSEAEALASLGAPMKRSSVHGIAPTNSRGLAPGTAYSLTTLNYFFAPYGPGRPQNPKPAKLAFLMFFDDRLVAYLDLSVVPDDTTAPMDEQKLAQLHQGQTTRAQAIALLGTPNAQMLHVLDAQNGASQIDYISGHLDGGMVQTRLVQVDFDRFGRMTTYTVQDRSNPLGTAPIPLPLPQAPAGPPGGLQPILPGDRSHT